VPENRFLSTTRSELKSGCYKYTRWLTLVLMALAAALMLPGLGAKSFWLDECWSVLHASDPQHFWRVGVHWDTNMWLYYALLQPWLLFGVSETWVRAFSVLCAVAAIPVVVRIGVDFFSPRAGLLAGLFLAVHPFFIYQAREARAYTLVMLFSVCATWAFLRMCAKPTVKRGARYGLLATLAIYAHGFGALHAAGHALALLALGWRNLPWRALIAAGLVAAAGLAFMWSLMTAMPGSMITWLKPPDGSVLRAALHTLGGSHAWSTALYAASVAAALFFLVHAVRSGQPMDRIRWAVALGTVVIPVVVAFGWSVLVSPVFNARYLATMVPALALSLGAALDAWRRPIAPFVLAALVVGCGLKESRRVLAAPGWEDWRGLTAHVRSAARDGDALIWHVHYMSVPLDVYELMEGPLPVTREKTGAPQHPQEAPPVEWLRALASRYTRVWLVLGHNQFDHLGSREQNEQLMKGLTGSFERVSETRYGAITLILWQALPLEAMRSR
jgi:mannosyltransferase